MFSTIEELINTYNPKNANEMKLALREIVQNIVLIGLSRANFFSKASFYGGTALRIFYGLNRYSEDLDFTLNNEEESFTLEPYINSIKEVAYSYGFNISVEIKNKKVNTPIESAFAKLNTYQTFISLGVNDSLTNILHKDETLKVKFVVDCYPSLGFDVDTKWITNPEFATVNVLDLESLFAGKIHAILCRNYKNNVKGRDYYDFIFFINKKIKPNLLYLKNKLIESNKISESEQFNIEILKKMLSDRFNEVDFSQVKKDAQKFTIKNENLDFYCKDLFIECLNML